MWPLLYIAVLSALIAPSHQTQPTFKKDLQDLLQKDGIPEDTEVGESLGFVSCFDADYDDILYLAESDYLNVNSTTGEVTLRAKLNKESELENKDTNPDNYRVTFTCFDLPVSGEGSSDKVSYEITIKDVNDEIPIFNTTRPERFVFNVSESARPGYILDGIVNVLDNDDGHSNAQMSKVEFDCSNNTDVSQGQQDGCSFFKLNWVEDVQGVINVTIEVLKALDYEKDRAYMINAIAVDKGTDAGRRNTGSTGFLINILDSQDTNPEFVKIRSRYEVQEGLPVDTTVSFKLYAQDGDAGSRRRVTFEILNNLDAPRGYNLFKIGAVKHEGSGIYAANVQVNAPIDYEEITVYNFTAKAIEVESDGTLTNASTTRQFTVYILDKNDNSPEFDQSEYYISVPEATKTQNALTIPMDIIVSDVDSFNNGVYEVKIVRQTYPGTFRIKPEGEMTGEQTFYLIGNVLDYLDYETELHREQIIELQAIETRTRERFFGEATVYVSLTDRNDHDPRFNQTRYEVAVREDELLNTIILTLSATDKDSGVNGEIVYSADRYKNVFEVNSVTGAIKLVGRLNAQVNRYAFLAYASDKGAESRTTEVYVVVTVIVFNKDGPVFTSTSYSTVVDSGTMVLQPSLRLQAFDSNDQNITYRIVRGNTPTNSFVLDPFSGQLTLREPVTIQLTPNMSGFFSLAVNASDNGNPPFATETIVTVLVLAKNDFRPVFKPTIYYTTISETIRPGVSLEKVTATDDDFGSNGKITYRVGEGGLGNFDVREDIVYTSAFPSFDYDVSQSMEVKILAIDGGFPQYTGTATLSVTIMDANNKPPKFIPQSYLRVISEATRKGTTVLRLSATDPDASFSLQYTLLQDTIKAYSKGGSATESQAYDAKIVFEVNADTGVIILSNSGPGLDRRFVASMEFQVEVRDTNAAPNTGTQSDIAYISIIIEGLPDTELYFNLPWTKDEPFYRLKFSESDPIGTVIKTLQVRDPVDNGSVSTTYEEVPFTDSGDYFRLSQTNKGQVILQKELDYESGSLVHYVVVRAVKEPVLSYPRRTATASIYLEVLNANDNRPQFTLPSYNFTVREGQDVGTSIATLRAYDLDGPSFGSVEILLSFGQNRNDFRIEPISSQSNGRTVTTQVRLLVNQKLDYERIRSYDLTIIARDGSSSSSGSRLTGQAKVYIRVEDVNDNRPTFRDVNRTFSVAETAPKGKQLGVVVASDYDSGDNGKILYSLESDSDMPLRLFSIDETTGILKTQQSLQGLAGSYNLRVVAKDKGSPPLNSSMPVFIKIQGVEDDDGTPKWLLPFTFEVAVTEHNQTRLDIQVKAIARTPNADITYSLGRFDDDYLSFRIDSNTGNIFVIADLDREIQETYTLLLEATDTVNPDKMSRRPFTVNLIDMDDNDPSFEKSRYAACPTSFQVPTVYTTPDDTPAYTIVGRAVACDPDGPGNNEVYYERFTGSQLCQENYNTALEVMSNGSIRSTKRLDYEENVQYLICVSVRADSANRRRRDYDERQMIDTDKVAYIIVRVTDVNDNGPLFPDRDVLAVMETLPPEDTVIRVSANDPDGPLNDRVIYAIKSIMYYPLNGKRPFSMRGAFTINPDNGVVTASLPSYRDFAHGYFELEIDAYDFQNRMFNDTVIVKVVVYQRSQILKVVLDQRPEEGQRVALEMMRALNEEGKDEGREFFLIKASEHRTGSSFVASQTDICFVIVVNNRAYDASTGVAILDSDEYKDVLKDFKVVNRGTCYPLLSTEDKVKWRDLWWVLVAIAIFIFVCAIILLITICILYDRYKNYMETQKTYLVAQ